jgi:CarD family transcriptional regulator
MRDRIRNREQGEGRDKVFQAGDAIVHPIRGAGVIVRIEERMWRGGNSLYYRIKLLDQPTTRLMIPTSEADTLGLRPAIAQSEVDRVWRVLGSKPQSLPSNHKERYKVLEDKLYAGDVFQIAEVVRDMAWRRQMEGSLTTVGKRRYDESVRMLAGELAAVQGIDVSDAEAQILEKVRASLA